MLAGRVTTILGIISRFDLSKKGLLWGNTMMYLEWPSGVVGGFYGKNTAILVIMVRGSILSFGHCILFFFILLTYKN